MALFDDEKDNHSSSEMEVEKCLRFGTVHEQVQIIDERVNRRPREDQIEEIVKEAVDDELRTRAVSP